MPQTPRRPEYQFILRFRREPTRDATAPPAWRGTVLLVPDSARTALDDEPVRQPVASIAAVPDAIRTLLRKDGVEECDLEDPAN